MASYLHRPIPFEHVKTIDRELTVALYENGVGFFRGADNPASDREHTLYFLAIAIELALLAYLLDRGVNNDWCKVHIRHDLRKALAYARLKSFSAVPEGLPTLIALLSPYYRRHAVAWLAKSTGSSLSLSEARETVWRLLGAVGVEIHDRDAGDRPPSLQRADG